MVNFTEDTWRNITDKLSVIHNYGIFEKKWLVENKLAKLIAATPYLAESVKPDIVSFSHLSLYLLSLTETGKTIFVHREIDDSNLYSRLDPLIYFSTGDQEVIEASNALLGLCMLSNYKKDSQRDRKSGKYNPVASGKWQFDTMKETLLATLAKNSRAEELLQIYPVQEALKGNWM